MTFSPGMMQTAANEARAIEEEAMGTGGLCVSVYQTHAVYDGRAVFCKYKIISMAG